jgi:UDP-3-O-[3-hydroxymyristoyl] N-acetylglucosamine deacetylase
MEYQKTLENVVECSGVGLHSGRPVNLWIKPASVNNGIVFKRIDLPDQKTVKAFYTNLFSARYATSLGNEDTIVKTVEHLLSCLMGLEVDNALIELDSEEIPVFDGSADVFVKLLQKAGIRIQGEPRKFIKVKRPIELFDKDMLISVVPYPRLRITYTIDFPHPLLRNQTKTIDLSPENFIKEIAPARTFCLYEEVEYLRKQGLAKGGSLENAVVLGKDGIYNESLRFEDECVRHKILDLLGDLALLGTRILGHIKVYKGGHQLHSNLVREILTREDTWSYTSSNGHIKPEGTLQEVSAQGRRDRGI